MTTSESGSDTQISLVLTEAFYLSDDTVVNGNGGGNGGGDNGAEDPADASGTPLLPPEEEEGPVASRTRSKTREASERASVASSEDSGKILL